MYTKVLEEEVLEMQKKKSGLDLFGKEDENSLFRQEDEEQGEQPDRVAGQCEGEHHARPKVYQNSAPDHNPNRTDTENATLTRLVCTGRL